MSWRILRHLLRFCGDHTLMNKNVLSENIHKTFCRVHVIRRKKNWGKMLGGLVVCLLLSHFITVKPRGLHTMTLYKWKITQSSMNQ